MEQEKKYRCCRFSAEVLKEAISTARAAAGDKENLRNVILRVQHDESSWEYDTTDEFLADYRKHNKFAHCRIQGEVITFSVICYEGDSSVSMRSTRRADIEAVFDVFEKHAAASKLETPPPPPTKPVIFIGHGHCAAWRDLKDHLQDKHGIKVEAYETGARAGHTIRDILEDMVSKSSFALLVLTGEDEQADGAIRARQNVIHEAGLFQGRIGFSRAILLLEEGVEEFSNVQGVQYIRFAKNNIKETFGEVLATLRREFPR